MHVGRRRVKWINSMLFYHNCKNIFFNKYHTKSIMSKKHHLHFSVIAAHLNSAVISNNNANIKSCCWHTILKVTKLLPSPMLAAYPPLLTRMLHEHEYLSQLFWSGFDQYLLQITTSLVASEAHVVFWQHDCLKFVCYLIYKNTHAQCLRLIVCCVFTGSLCRQRLSETLLKHLSGQRLVSMQPYSTSEVYGYRPAVKHVVNLSALFFLFSLLSHSKMDYLCFVLFFVNDEKLVWRWTSRCIMHKQQNGKEENKTCLIALFGWLDSSCCTGQTTRLLLLANQVITRQKYRIMNYA